MSLIHDNDNSVWLNVTRWSPHRPALIFVKQIAVLQDGNAVFSLSVEFEPQCTAIHPGKTDVAVGGKTV